MLKSLIAAVTALGFASAWAQPASADVLADIKARGKVIIGVKADYKPFGFRDPSGAIIGIEPDLAALVAKKLGVQLELVGVVSANRFEFLNQGKTDITIATVSVTPERRKQVQFIEPLYYADFVNVMLAKSAPVKSWDDLKGKKICATTGAWYNKDLTQKYGPELISFDGSEKPLVALKNGDCVGYVYDQTFLSGKLLDDAWKADYQFAFTGILEAPWGIAVKTGEDNLKKVLEEITLEWFKGGVIVALEQKWGVPPTEYTKRMAAEYKGK